MGALSRGTATRKCSKCKQRFPVGGGHNARTCGKTPQGGRRTSQVPRNTERRSSQVVRSGDVLHRYLHTLEDEVPGGPDTEEGNEKYNLSDLETLWELSANGNVAYRNDENRRSSSVIYGQRVLTGTGRNTLEALHGFTTSPYTSNISPSDWKTFLTKFPPVVREKLAEKENLPASVYVALVVDKSSKVKEKILQNPSTPQKVIAFMVDDVVSKGKPSLATIKSFLEVSRNPRADKGTLRKIYIHIRQFNKDEWGVTDGSGNKRPRVSWKAIFARHETLANIANHPNVSVGFFREIAETDEQLEVSRKVCSDNERMARGGVGVLPEEKRKILQDNASVVLEANEDVPRENMSRDQRDQHNNAIMMMHSLVRINDLLLGK